MLLFRVIACLNNHPFDRQPSTRDILGDPLSDKLLAVASGRFKGDITHDVAPLKLYHFTDESRCPLGDDPPHLLPGIFFKGRCAQCGKHRDKNGWSDGQIQNAMLLLLDSRLAEQAVTKVAIKTHQGVDYYVTSIGSMTYKGKDYIASKQTVSLGIETGFGSLTLNEDEQKDIRNYTTQIRNFIEGEKNNNAAIVIANHLKKAASNLPGVIFAGCWIALRRFHESIWFFNALKEAAPWLPFIAFPVNGGISATLLSFPLITTNVVILYLLAQAIFISYKYMNLSS